MLCIKQPKWKSRWLKQRKADARDPKLRSFKYTCMWGHIRIEKNKMVEPLPDCQACSQLGKTSRFRYVGIYTMTRTDAKKSKFPKK